MAMDSVQPQTPIKVGCRGGAACATTYRLQNLLNGFDKKYQIYKEPIETSLELL